MKFYGTGTKRVKGKDGVVSYVSVMLPLTETSRVGAVNQAERIAKRERVKLDGVYLAKGSSKAGSTLTKNAAKRKAMANSKSSK
ncbi:MULTISPECIES: hypothetical protein [Paenibacillus]|uniref:hypothetical protein n=1 Tax=Paenibacillus TaxID=44249 RepID=UPI000F9156BB|nr:hypothetical protein [Paenibacillus xylanexedens]RPK20029.1 hypothetical protein EDO6_06546 [Paenibacillus xylanexedens]